MGPGKSVVFKQTIYKMGEILLTSWCYWNQLSESTQHGVYAEQVLNELSLPFSACLYKKHSLPNTTQLKNLTSIF